MWQGSEWSPWSSVLPGHLKTSFPVPVQGKVMWLFLGQKNVGRVRCPLLRLKHLNPMYQFSSVQFSRSVVSDFLRPHESQHARPPCPSPTPGVYPNQCPSSRWCSPAISFSVLLFSSCPQIPPSTRVFSNESTLCMRWPKYWSFSFSISPSKNKSTKILCEMSMNTVQGLYTL